MDQLISVRFAPSPTGPLHIGGVRTALYNYLLARKHRGRFVLRIEDTDQKRFVSGAEQYILDTLQWLGIEADEGPCQGGLYGPYRQSARKKFYQNYAEYLVEAGKAYYAFDTPQELDAMRQRLQAAKVASPQYNALSREWMKNSLTLPQEDVKDRLCAGVSFVIRIKVPYQEVIRFYDQVRGWIKVHTATLDDKILIKSDGTPTYHLANVVDDYLMKITHVIRGEEWLPSTPIHVLLYQYLGIEAVMPQFAHLPLLLKPEGPGKLSKRDADQYGFPIFPIAWKDPHTGEYIPGFREKGYLPEALMNFLVLLGWSPADGRQELFSQQELIQAFSLERINKSGVKFDIQKAAWFNKQYLHAKPPTERLEYLTAALDEHQIAYTLEQARQVCWLIQDRAVFPQDFWEQGKYFFKIPEHYDASIIQRKWDKSVRKVLKEWVVLLKSLESFEASEIKITLTKIIQAKKINSNQVMPIVRVALTGISAGPNLMKTMEVLGKEEVIKRLLLGLERFSMLSMPCSHSIRDFDAG